MDYGILILSIPIGACVGYIYADRLHRKTVTAELEAERHVLKDALKQISDSHNNIVLTQQAMDARLMDVEQHVQILVQGTKRK